MVVRYNIKCLTCETPHTLRISLGHNKEQVHTLSCQGCNEDFTVTLELDFDKVTYKINCVENCKYTAQEGVIINVEPYHPIPNNLVHQDNVFPWMHQVEGNWPNFREAVKKTPGKFVDAFQVLGGQPLILDEWRLIKRGWSLTTNGHIDLAKKQFAQYKYDQNPDLDHILCHFSLRLISPNKYGLFQNGAETYSEILRKHTSETKRFRDYYRNELRQGNFEGYYDIYSQYFRHYTDYQQTLLYVKNDINLPHNSEVTSNSFKYTKLFYGNAFEVITTGFTILACINNIHNGRSYDQFETMDLKKYLNINKANRANPFQNNTKIGAFSECIDSRLRNASHHGAMRLNKKNNIITYRSGGTGAENRITYTDYLTKCNEIMLNIAALVALEILIAFQQD